MRSAPGQPAGRGALELWGALLYVALGPVLIPATGTALLLNFGGGSA